MNRLIKNRCGGSKGIKVSGEQGEHVKERIKKGARILGQVWGIGKRKFGKNWGTRLWLSNKVIWSVISYGVEIWGWKGREEVEKLEKRYLRSVLEVSRRVAGYLVKEELQRDLLKGISYCIKDFVPSFVYT